MNPILQSLLRLLLIRRSSLSSLVICWMLHSVFSPLINNSAAIETLQYLNKLSEINNNEVHLLTVNFPKDSIYYDETLRSMMDDEIKVHV